MSISGLNYSSKYNHTKLSSADFCDISQVHLTADCELIHSLKKTDGYGINYLKCSLSLYNSFFFFKALKYTRDKGNWAITRQNLLKCREVRHYTSEALTLTGKRSNRHFADANEVNIVFFFK